MTLQLHVFACTSFVTIFLLWDWIIALMFFVQLYDNFIVFLLKILYNADFGGKCFLTSSKNCCPTLVFTDLLKGGLYHSMSLLLLLLFLCVFLAVTQPLIVYMMFYFGFLLAELFEFSGIIW